MFHNSSYDSISSGMTDKTLKKLIDKLNNGNTGGLIHLRPFSENVDYGRVWLNAPKKTDRIVHPDGPFSFYFIKNEDGRYVATVLDMSTDLHWFVDRKFRKRGYLTNAMKMTILPHLLQSRERQRITIDESQIGKQNYLSSKGVALKLGFEQAENEWEFFLQADRIDCDIHICGENRLPQQERMEQLKKEINYLGRSLWIIQTEIEMGLGESCLTEELLGLAEEVKGYASKVEDVWWDHRTGRY